MSADVFHNNKNWYSLALFCATYLYCELLACVIYLIDLHKCVFKEFLIMRKTN